MSDDLTDLIGAIYDTALGSGAWPDLLTRIADLAGVENAAMVVIDPRIGLSGVLTPRADPAVVAAYNAHWWQYDPTASATAAKAPGQITDLSHTGRDVYHASVFQNEFWAKSGLGAERLASNLYTDGVAFGSFVLQTSRTRDEITDDMVSACRVLLPHLVRSVQIQRRLLNLTAALIARDHPGTEGLMLVDRDLRLLWADADAEMSLALQGAFRIAGGRLALSDAAASYRLEAAVRASDRPDSPAARQGGIVFACPQSGAPFVVEVIPYRPPEGVALPIIDGGPAATALIAVHHDVHRTERRIARLMETYRLTRAEARLAIEIAKGDGRAAAAARLGISVNTARTHLSSIFGKMGVHRQAELMRKLD